LGDAFNEKADVYSFGIVLWEFVSRSEPFSHHSDFDLFVEAVCMQQERPPLPDDCLPSLKKLIQKCWTANPSERPSFSTIVDALENIIIEFAIDDEVGRSVWKNYFFRKENVLWGEEFVPILAQFLGVTTTNPQKNESLFIKEIAKLIETLSWRCLQSLLVDNKKDRDLNVNIEKFGQILNWFGPFKDPDDKYRFLSRVQDILSCPWFFGSIEYDEAVNFFD